MKQLEYKYAGPDPIGDTRTWETRRDTPDAPANWSGVLVGRRIVQIAKARKHLVSLVLDDGTSLDLEPVRACCVDYEVSEIATEPFDGVIMRVLTMVNDKDGLESNTRDNPRIFRLFVYGQDGTQAQIARFDGSDGTGYYGTGFNVTVRRVVQGQGKSA